MISWRAKLRAFLIHLILSAIVISLFLVVVTQFWFPGPLFGLEDVWQGLKVLIPVDAILGPILTLIIFVPGKKSLKTDLSIIAALQFSALIYGGYIIYGQRPVAFAFVIDRFEIVLASENYAKKIPMDRFSDDEKDFPLMTYVMPASTREERSNFLIQGINIKKQPERHYPIKQYILRIAEKALDDESLKHTTAESNTILQKFRKSNEYKNNNLLMLPLQASTYKSIIIVIDSTTGKIKQYLEVDPWGN